MYRVLFFGMALAASRAKRLFFEGDESRLGAMTADLSESEWCSFAASIP